MRSSSAPDPPERLPVLVVEDDLDQAHLIRFLLEDTGEFRITLAQDGVRGSTLAREGEWALVITDLNLPGAFGFEVLEASRAASPRTPVLATTGFTDPSYVEEAKAKGADAVLFKPLDRDELLERIAGLIEGREAAPPENAPERRVALRVLAVAFRPGEAEAGCEATLQRHKARGDEVALLVLTGGGAPEGAREREAAHRLGIRSFVGSFDPEVRTFRSQAAELVGRAVRDLRPDVLYLPTDHRRDPLGVPVRDLALTRAGDVPHVFCYDPGDPTPEFRPDLYVAVDGDAAEPLERVRGRLPWAEGPEMSGSPPD